MSTRGSFMICRDGVCKEMFIRYDAYPQGAGVNVIDLIKTKNLNILYEAMCADMDGEEEPAEFSYESCKESGQNGIYLTSCSGPDYFVQDSLFCEYGYVVDLDIQELQLYVGGQTSPQENNRFGAEPVWNEFMDKPFYPCHLKAVFSLHYVRAMDAEQIALLMDDAEEAEDTLFYQEADGGSGETAVYADKLKELSEQLSYMAEKLAAEAELIMFAQPACKRRVDELRMDCNGISEAIAGLQKRRKRMRRDGNV